MDTVGALGACRAGVPSMIASGTMREPRATGGAGNPRKAVAGGDWRIGTVSSVDG